MQIDRRNEPRTEAKGLNAKMSVFQPNGSLLLVDVSLLDISHSGIKLRVKKPLVTADNTKVQLQVELPHSGLPVIVNAEIVHNKFDSEFGIHYIDLQPEDPLEQLITECKNNENLVT
jgi:hypothetical protein